MNILLAASFTEEIAETLEYLEKNWTKKTFFEYTKGDVSVITLSMGAGSTNAAFAIARQEAVGEFDYVVNPGVAIAISRTLDINRVYLLEQDCFGDIGLEEADGSFSDQHDLNWVDPNSFPYLKGFIKPKKLYNPTFLPRCSGITVNRVPGTLSNISAFEKKYHHDIMTLDGAGILYACRMLQLESIQYRVTTRFLEPWQKEMGDIEKALEQLNMRTIDILEKLVQENVG